MSSDSISVAVAKILNDNEIPYMIVGSLSTSFHSIVRSTKDADLVIQSDLGKAATLVSKNFPDLELDPQFYFEGVTGTTKLLLRSKSEEFSVELFGLADDAHDQERFKRRQLVKWQGIDAWIASAEDAVVTKLRWSQHAGRKKDIVDVENLLAANGDSLDFQYIEHWCDVHGTRKILDQIRAELNKFSCQ